jgi:hypothetical protein
MTKGDWIKILGIAVSAISASATLVAGWVDGVKMEETIDRKITEALSKANKGES